MKPIGTPTATPTAQTELLKQKIYNIICYCCKKSIRHVSIRIRQTKFKAFTEKDTVRSLLLSNISN